jgi:predicted O-methyltransferase YrrM
MENFKIKPRYQPLLFTPSEEEVVFDLNDFLQTLVVKIDEFNEISKPKQKRKQPDTEFEESEFEESEKELEKEEKLKDLLFLVKKLGKIYIHAIDCGYHSVHVNNESHIMYNRVAFFTYIKQLLGEYVLKLEEQQNMHSCNAMKQQKSFSLLAHQELVRRYINSHTPYRGLLLYHGLGSGKTCSSIAIAENMKEYKKIIVMCPASLKTNYIKELKKYGEPAYNAAIHHWKQINSKDPEYLIATKQLCIPLKKLQPIWITVPDEPANFNDLSFEHQQLIQLQIYQLILTKYTFIHYNGLSENAHVWKQLMKDEKEEGNPFHNKVIIVDEAHNLISRIVNKIDKKGQNIAMKLYSWLKTAENSKIVLLSGTPIINSPYEMVILYNILRGTTKVYTFDNKQSIGSETVFSRNSSNPLLKDVDLVDTTQPSKFVITKCPRGFTLKQNRMQLTDPIEFNKNEMEEKEFKENVEKALQCTFKDTQSYDALPEKEDEFNALFMANDNNLNMLMRRITGLTSYFPDLESLMPRLNAPDIIYIPMTDTHFKYYNEKRVSERDQEKRNAQKKQDEQTSSNSYKIKSRLACNFAFPVGIERPQIAKEVSDFDLFEQEEYQSQETETIDKTEVQTLQKCYAQIKAYFANEPDLVPTYSPKFDVIANTILRINGAGKQQLHLVYSQFLSLEGLNLFAIILQLPKYGEFVAFDIVKEKDKWTIPSSVKAKQNKYVLYTGAMEPEKREIIRNIFNGDMEGVPSELHEFVNRMEPITLFMITSAGAEGISLKNVQNVHIMEPYWNPIRIDQVIGRARRICSHASLPEEERYVNVYKYIMVLADEKQKTQADRDKFNKEPVPVTTDEYLMKLSIRKNDIIRKFQTYIQDSSIDCFLHKTTCFTIPLTDPKSLLFNYNPNMEQDKGLAKIDDTYLKYKKSLDEVSKIINNPYIYDMFYSWSFKLKGKQVDFDSNINSYEGCFIAKLIQIYNKDYKKDKVPLNVLELGLARGTSALIILNELIKLKSTYTAIDMNQTDQWKNIGRDNIEQFLHVMKTKYEYTFIEENTVTALPKLIENGTKLHISFIDASHEEDIVIQDMENSDQMLLVNGIMILDDVKHKGVKEAVIRFMATNKDRYRRVSIDKDELKTEKVLYEKDSVKESVTNPDTMFCLQKLK